MKLRNLAMAAALLLPLGAMAQGLSKDKIKEDLLTGDTKLACEAILCLSTGSRPNECQPSIHKYFSIRHKRMSSTINARKDFLKQCPSSNEKDMPQLIDALANGAGRCDAEELNRVMSRKVMVKVCKEISPAMKRHLSHSRSGRERLAALKDGKECHDEIQTIILNQKPSYCQAYHNHEWTRTNETIRYQGDPKNGGKWVDVK